MKLSSMSALSASSSASPQHFHSFLSSAFFLLLFFSFFFFLCLSFFATASLEKKSVSSSSSHDHKSLSGSSSSFSSFSSSANTTIISSSMDSPPPVDDFLGVEFEAGYVNIGNGRGQMFYWYFPFNITKDPPITVLWITGGPGCSSEIAVLNENGPFWVRDNATLKLNEFSWSNKANVVYVDQPLGTGFSIASVPSDFVHNEAQVAEDMAQFLEAFMVKHPKLQNNPFYITGESYAGHYIPAIAHYVMFERQITGLNLQGIAIGNGWVDPYVQYPAYAEFGLENQLINMAQYKVARAGFALCDQLIDRRLFPIAFVECNKVTQMIIGDRNPYDIRLKCENPPLCYNTTSTDVFLNKPRVQERLGVKKTWEECDTLVYFLLLADWVNDMRFKIQKLLDNGLRVLVYNGDKDYICNWRGGLNWVNAVEWKFAEKFRNMELSEWIPSGGQNVAAGEVKRVENFIFLKVYNAGHMVPMDQPAVALLMISEFLTGDLQPTGEKRNVSEEDLSIRRREDAF